MPDLTASLAQCAREDELGTIYRRLRRCLNAVAAPEHIEALLEFVAALPSPSDGAQRKAWQQLQVGCLEAMLMCRATCGRGLAKKGALAHALRDALAQAYPTLSEAEICQRVIGQLDTTLALDARAMHSVTSADLFRWDMLRGQLEPGGPPGERLLQLLHASPVPRVRGVVLEQLLRVLQHARAQLQPRPAPTELIAELAQISLDDRAALAADAAELFAQLIEGACQQLAAAGIPVAIETLQDLSRLGQAGWLAVLGRHRASACPPPSPPAPLFALLAQPAGSPMPWVREEALEAQCALLRVCTRGQLEGGVWLAAPFLALAAQRRAEGQAATARRLGTEALACAVTHGRDIGPAELWRHMAAQAEDEALVVAAIEALGDTCDGVQDALAHLAVWAEHAHATQHTASVAMHTAMLMAARPDAPAARRAQAGALVPLLYRRGHMALCLSFLSSRQHAWQRGIWDDIQPAEVVFLVAVRDWLQLTPDPWLEQYLESAAHRALCLAAPAAFAGACADVQRGVPR